jgi:erythromycin esterase
MIRGGPDSWNIRDHHMVDVLNKLMSFHGNQAKVLPRIPGELLLKQF